MEHTTIVIWHLPDPAEQFHNPYLAMGNNPVMYTDPDGEFAFLIPFLIGAGISVVTNGISNSIHGGEFFDGAGRAALIGGISGVLSAGIGSAAGGMMGAEKIAFQTLMHGHLGGMTSALTGGEYTSGFLAGSSGSLAATGTGMAMQGVESNLTKGAATIGTGAITGGFGAEVAGGNFWDGARNGAISSGLNHAIHAGYLGKGLMMASITGRTRHLFGPDAESFSIEAGAQVGVGIKPIEKGVYHLLRGSKTGWYEYDGVAFSAGTPQLALEASAIELYYTGTPNNITPKIFTGTYHQWSVGVDVGIGLSGIALYSRLSDQNSVYGFGIGISLDAIPNYIDFTYQYGATTLSKDSYHDNPMRRIFGSW